MKKDEKLSDFSIRFTKIIFGLKYLGERIKKKEVVSKLLQSMPVRYDSLNLSLENFRNMSSKSIEELF